MGSSAIPPERSGRRGRLRRRFLGTLLAVAVAAAVLAVAPPPAGAVTITVTTTANTGPGSMRAAFEQASANGTNDTIVLQAGATYLVCGVLTHSDTGRRLIVDGNGATLQRTCNSGLGTIRNQDAELDLQEMTVTGARGGSPGAVVSSGATAELFLDEVTLTDNQALGSGGGIFASGYVNISDSVISGNTAASGGGGIAMQPPYPAAGYALEIDDSVINDNVSDAAGGIRVYFAEPDPSVAITNSDISGNRATDGTIGQGGGLYIAGPLTMLWSTVSRNRSAGPGAGIWTNGDLSLHASTVSSNVTDAGSAHGGGGVLLDGASASMSLSTVVDNQGFALRLDAGEHLTAFGNVIGGSTFNCNASGFTTTTNGYNVEDDDQCGLGTGPGDHTGVADLGLLHLADNGGSGPTHHPSWTGGLIDTIPAANATCDNLLIGFDQRLLNRPIGTGCENGAVEFSPNLLPAHPFSDVPAWVDQSVRWIWFYEYAQGYSDGTFRPDEPVTRAQVARLLYRLEGSPDVSGHPAHGLSDVPAWVADAVTWAVRDPDAGGDAEPILTGFPDDTFRPNVPVTRAQLVRMLYRLAGSPDVSGYPAHGLSDVPAWVEDAVRWAVRDPAGAPLPVMTGFSDLTFRPDDGVTRAQVARALHRFSLLP